MQPGNGAPQQSILLLLWQPGDFVSRRAMRAVGLALWSVSTALSGAAAGFATLSMAPIGVRLGETVANQWYVVTRLIGRRPEPEVQAWIPIMLNSARASYINGVDLPVDGGFIASRIVAAG